MSADHHHDLTAELEPLLPYLPPRSSNLLLLSACAARCARCREVWDTRTAAQRDEPLDEVRLATSLGLSLPADLRSLREQSYRLLSLSPESRTPAIRRARVRFRSPALVVLLLVRAQRELASAPRRTLELAELAASVAEHGSHDPSLTALALAYAGNSHRSTGHLGDADPLMEKALEQLARHPHPSLWLRAEIASLYGSLLKDHRHLDDAELHLLNAAAMFKAAGDRERVARVRLKLAACQRLAANRRGALLAVRDALGAVDPWRCPELHLAALHNLALYLCEAGEPAASRHLLRLAGPLYDPYPAVHVRRTWLRGLVAQALGEAARAEMHLKDALAEFVEAGAAFYGALVAVDLAELLLAEGRAAEVVAVTRDLPGLFQSLDVHPEAVAATLLFHKAAAERTVSEEYAAIFRRFLERAQVDRSVQFAPPG